MEDLTRLLDKRMELPQRREGYKAELAYFEKTRAHRVYQYAMSRYKLLRYTPQNIKDKRINWQLVDHELRQALERYNEIKVKVGEPSPKKQQLFIDLIIKITVCRAFANLNNKKILTAEKILESTRWVLNSVEKGKIKMISEGREGAPMIPLEILKQKYLLHKGLLLVNLNKDQDAARCFTHCLRTGAVYDVRIRKECAEQLYQIMSKYGQESRSLGGMLDSFKHRNKDIVFLVNSNQGGMNKVKDVLKQIFDRGLEAQDRISLITFAKNARVVFSLVEKDRNFTQLRNQIDRIEPPGERVSSNLYKAVKEAIKEFKENGGGTTPTGNKQDGNLFGAQSSKKPRSNDNHRYIVCFTNDAPADPSGRTTKEDVQALLK